jgi:hypothetical protein
LKNSLYKKRAFSKTVSEKSLFEKETLQESQQGHGLIKEYHSKVIFGLTFL